VSCKLVFEPTEGKLEYLQDRYNELIPEHHHSYSDSIDCIEFTGGLYLENGMCTRRDRGSALSRYSFC
jgi:hypothetical protein